MSDHQPIKRHPAMVQFSKDHHFGLLLTWKITEGLNNGVAPDRISDYVLYSYEEDLRYHFKEEEQLIFSRLSKEDTMRQRAEKEHTTINDLAGKIGQNKKDKTLLKLFADTLRDHIRFEERKLFGYVQEKLTPAEIAEISSYKGIDSAEVDARWKDVFWGNKGFN